MSLTVATPNHLIDLGFYQKGQELIYDLPDNKQISFHVRYGRLAEGGIEKVEEDGDIKMSFDWDASPYFLESIKLLLSVLG